MLSATLACFDFSQLLSIALLTCLKRHHITYAFPPQMFLLLPNRANTRSSFQALVLGQWAGNAVEHYKQSKYSKMPSTAHIQESDKQFKCTTSKSFFQKHCKQCKYSKMPSKTHFEENALRLNLFFESITNNQTMQISEHAVSSLKKMQTTQIHS